MSTEITNEEPVLMLNDKKYIISEMTDLQKAFVIELNALEQDINTTRRSLDRLVLAKEGYTSRLQQDLESPPEPSEESQTINPLHSPFFIILRLQEYLLMLLMVLLQMPQTHRCYYMHSLEHECILF